MGARNRTQWPIQASLLSIPSFSPVDAARASGRLSRKRMAKQLLPLNSKKSMIQETVERLLPLAKAKQFWIITNEDLRDAIVRQLKGLDKKQIIAEPAGRNTAPAIGLAAFLLARQRSQRRHRNVSLRSRHREREALSRGH